MATVTRTDPAVIELSETLEKVRERTDDFLASWMKRMRRSDLKSKIELWKMRHTPVPTSDRVRAAIFADESID